MKRVHYAILAGEILSYALIVTFIFADSMFDLTSVLRRGGPGLSPAMAPIAACLVGLVATINIWLTCFYMRKSRKMQDWVIVCAWTHRIKSGSQWLTLEEFLTENLGCQVSHGLSEQAYRSMVDEMDAKWRTLEVVPPQLPDPKQPPVSSSDDPAPAPRPT